MKYLLIFFLLAFVGLYVLISGVKGIMRMLFGDPSRRRGNAPRQQRRKKGLDTSTAKRKKKVIPHDEGEYVDYEDVSDKQ